MTGVSHAEGKQQQEVSTWTIDPVHSLAEFAVRHMMVSTVKGRFTEVSGTLTIDDADLAKSSVKVEIAAASIDTRDEKRNAHLRSADFLDVERFPKLTFKSTKVEPRGTEELRITGDLTIKDVTRRVVLKAAFNGRGKTPYGTEVTGYSATTEINRRDFGLVWNVSLETGGVLVGDNVKILIEVEAVRQN